MVIRNNLGIKVVFQVCPSLYQEQSGNRDIGGTYWECSIMFHNGTDLEHTWNFHSDFVPDPHSLLAPISSSLIMANCSHIVSPLGIFARLNRE